MSLEHAAATSAGPSASGREKITALNRSFCQVWKKYLPQVMTTPLKIDLSRLGLKLRFEHLVDFFRKRHTESLIEKVAQCADIRCAKCLVEIGAR